MGLRLRGGLARQVDVRAVTISVARNDDTISEEVTVRVLRRPTPNVVKARVDGEGSVLVVAPTRLAGKMFSFRDAIGTAAGVGASSTWPLAPRTGAVDAPITGE